MAFLVFTALIIPPIAVACAAWQRLSRPSAPPHYLAAAFLTAFLSFGTTGLLTLFTLAFFGVAEQCSGYQDCDVLNVLDALQWWLLALALICAALASLCAMYCQRISSREFQD